MPPHTSTWSKRQTTKTRKHIPHISSLWILSATAGFTTCSVLPRPATPLTAALIWRQCTAQISQLNKSSNKEHCICKAVHWVFASGAAFCLPCKGRWVAEGNSEGFCRVIWNLNRMSVTFNPSVRSQTRVQLPFQGSLLTFPHTVGNHPFQGSLNNPSVYSLRS